MLDRNRGILLLLSILALSFTLAAGGKCDDANSLSCPNCGGTSVSDCLECDGFFSTDLNHKMCFDRKLFSTINERNADDHYPFLWNDILGAIVWFCAAGVATACGVGGGGIYVPLGIILLRFSSKPASGLSQASIFGASLGGLILNIRNKHPDTKIRDTIGERDLKGKLIPYEKDLTKAQIEQDEIHYLNGAEGRKFYTRPVIDFDMALFLAPMEMAGAVLGVLIQKVMPNWLFLTLAGVILGITSYKTYLKFFAAYKVDKEKRERQALLEDEEGEIPSKNNHTEREKENKSDFQSAGCEIDTDLEVAADSTSNEQDRTVITNGIPVKAAAEDNDDDLSQARSGDGSNNSKLSFSTGQGSGAPVPGSDEDTEETLAQRREFLEDDSRQYPKEKLLFLFLLWIGLAIITFLKGGKGVDSVIGITCKDGWYFVLIALQFLWTIGFAVVFGLKAVNRTESRMRVNYPFHQNDVMWTYHKLRTYASFTFGAGIVAGLIGIGGGMVLGPLMLIMGVHPRVSSATTATMIVLTSSSVAIIFVTSGLVPWEYAVFYFCVCISGAYVGKKYIDAYVKKTGMASILIGILATIIGLATVGCFIIVLLNLNKNSWCFDGFKAFCDKKDDTECLANRFLEVVGVDIPSFITG